MMITAGDEITPHDGIEKQRKRDVCVRDKVLDARQRYHLRSCFLHTAVFEESFMFEAQTEVELLVENDVYFCDCRFPVFGSCIQCDSPFELFDRLDHTYALLVTQSSALN